MDFIYYIDRSPFTITTIMHVDDYNVSGPDVAKVYITTGSKGEDLHKNVIGYFSIILIACNGANQPKSEVLGDHV